MRGWEGKFFQGYQEYHLDIKQRIIFRWIFIFNVHLSPISKSINESGKRQNRRMNEIFPNMISLISYCEQRCELNIITFVLYLVITISKLPLIRWN